MRYFAVITAGGSGTRMKSKLPKQFIQIDGKPIIHRTIELFTQLDFPVEIILVLPHAYIDLWKEYYIKNNLIFSHIIVEGGLTRYHSVRAALAKVPDDVVVAVHDGVRPIVPKELLTKLFKYKIDENCAGVVPVLPVVESLRKKIYGEGGAVVGTQPVQREDFLIVQTPQVFDSTRLKLAYKRPYSPTFTDESTVMESCGYNLDTIEGSKFNLKITTPEDLEFARRLL